MRGVPEVMVVYLRKFETSREVKCDVNTDVGIPIVHAVSLGIVWVTKTPAARSHTPAKV